MPAAPDNAIELWTACLEALSGSVPEDDMATWLRPLQPAWAGEAFVLYASNAFVMDEVRRNYLSLMAPHLPDGFRIQVGSRAEASRLAAAPPAPTSAAKATPAPPRLPTDGAQAPALPWWPDDSVALPNTWVRSAVFTANTYGDDTVRPYRQRMKVASQRDINVYVTGEELNQADREVMAWLLEYQKDRDLVRGIRFSASMLLSDLGRPKNGAEVARLRASITRLRRSSCEISIYRENGSTSHFSEFNFVSDFTIDERSQTRGSSAKNWIVRISPLVASQFAGNAYTRMDQEMLRNLSSQLSKWLLGYYGSHANPYPVSVQLIYSLSDSKIAEPRRFRTKLKASLEDLVRIGFLRSWRFEGDLVHVERAPAPQRLT